MIVIAKDPQKVHKKRLCIDYSRTVNLYTELDAYPLPRIDDMVNELAKYKVFSTFDLKSAYHQIPIVDADKKFTAFEANGGLYQFCRLPFGVTNGVSMFQRCMDQFVEKEGLSDTFPYLDNITVGGVDQESHDRNVLKFQEAVSRWGLTLNESKSTLSTSSIQILGYSVSFNTIQPDSDRLQALDNLPPPSDMDSLKRTLGLFAYYSKCIASFSDKIRPLADVQSFPLSDEAVAAFNSLKDELRSATLGAIDESVPFVVECDASDYAISGTLNQNGRPVAFMSRSLNKSELSYPSVEKEATATIESVRKWRHLLLRSHFIIVTDQRSVSFMFDNRRRSKIKNSKIEGWRVDLAEFSYSIVYRPGSENVAPDALSRTDYDAYCALIHKDNLVEIHNCLCHLGITRLLHFVKLKNLPFSTEDVKRVCDQCQICHHLKPHFFNPTETATLVKAMYPFDRISIDFKGPLPFVSSNKYMPDSCR